MNTHFIKTFMGTVLLSTDPESVAKRKALGDTDASNDVMITFTLSQPLVEFGASENDCLETVAELLREMADSVLSHVKEMT